MGIVGLKPAFKKSDFKAADLQEREVVQVRAIRGNIDSTQPHGMTCRQRRRLCEALTLEKFLRSVFNARQHLWMSKEFMHELPDCEGIKDC